MANRFPLIVNSVSKKIEELIAGDNLDLTGSGLIANNSVGSSGQYLKSNGSTVLWDTPGDVYLTATQTITNKTIEASIISGTTNTFTNIPNSALVNSSITINGTAISLGGTVTTPNDNTTYAISAQDGTSGKKIIRLTSGGTGGGVNDDVTFVAGTNVTLARTGDEITINSSYIDTNTVTRVGASGGSLQSGDITLASGNANLTVSQVGNTISFSSVDTNTVTRLRGTATGTYVSGDLQLLAGSNVTITQGTAPNTDFTIASENTVTRLRGTTSGNLVSGDITIAAATGSTTSAAGGVFTTTGASTVSQTGNTITINSQYVNTVTSIKANSEVDANAVTGIINVVGSGDTTVVRSGNTITISSTDSDTTYTAAATGGLVLSGTVFSIKNNANLTGNRLPKWDSANTQFANSIITDDGSTVSIGGNLTVTGTTTTVDSTTILVADNEIEMRKGNNIVGSNGGIRLNRTTNSSGIVQTYTSLQWFESGGYWRIFDGSVGLRFVTETETQTLTNKTLTSPILTTPSLGVATATSINGLAISSTIGGVLTIANSKTANFSNTLTLTGTDGSSVAFGTGGTVAYTGGGLGQFTTTSSQSLRTVIDDETGQGVLVFNQSPKFSTSIGIADGETIIDVFNTTATTVNFAGAATSIIMGSSTSGTTTVRHAFQVNGNVTLGDAVTDTVSVAGPATFARDITIQSVGVGRGNNNVQGNTRVGESTLTSISGGSQNTAIGFEAGKIINSGAANTFVGYQAGVGMQGGQNNVALGKTALSTASTANKNVAIGVAALGQVSSTGYNVAVGHYAGNGVTGNGNVLIGPADNENSGDATFAPTTPGGDRQLVIGSGIGTWVRGDSSFNVTVPKDLGIGGNVSIAGTLTVLGTVTTIDSVRLRVDDKNIELGDVQGRNFSATFNTGTKFLNLAAGVTTENIIPGMIITTVTGGVTIPANTVVVNVTSSQIEISNNVSSTGNLNATFTVAGPSDTSADGGGITLKGTTDKTINWVNATQAWTLSEHLNLASGRNYRLNGQDFATSQFVQLPVGSSFARPSTPGLGMVRFNTTTQGFEGYGAVGWAPIGGGSEVQTYELDDLTTSVDGLENTFMPKLNYEKVIITNPFGLLITVNGIIQSAYINNPDVVNQSLFLGARDGYTVDYDGNIKFTESLPLGSDVFARVVAAALTPAQQKIYPFSPAELLLGYT